LLLLLFWTRFHFDGEIIDDAQEKPSVEQGGKCTVFPLWPKLTAAK